MNSMLQEKKSSILKWKYHVCIIYNLTWRELKCIAIKIFTANKPGVGGWMVLTQEWKKVNKTNSK